MSPAVIMPAAVTATAMTPIVWPASTSEENTASQPMRVCLRSQADRKTAIVAQKAEK